MDKPLNLVVVEDHELLRSLICQALAQRGHQVVGLSCAEDVDSLSSVDPVDIFLVDLNLPGEDGLTLTHRLKRVYPSCGVIMVTARSDLADRVAGYDSGADIYMPKPIEVEELCAAVDSLARRMAISHSVKDSAFELDQQALQISAPDGQVVSLSAAETQILNGFARVASQRLAIWQLLQTLDTDLDQVTKASLEVRIARLRKKLISIGAPLGCIESVRGEGYQLCIPIRVI